MVWFYLALGGGGLVVATRYLRVHRRVRRTNAEALDCMRALAAEDLAQLDAELQGLSHQALDRDGRLSLTRAQASYDTAAAALAEPPGKEAVRAAVEAVARGRYELVCARASLAGGVPPERRVPCFFDPQHGPSSADVLWTDPGRGSRTVPTCADDIARLTAGERPLARLVEYAGLRTPYWEAGAAFAPYGVGYFGSGGAGASHQALAVFGGAERDPDGRIAFGGGKFGTGPAGAFGIKGDPDGSGSGSHTAG